MVLICAWIKTSEGTLIKKNFIIYLETLYTQLNENTNQILKWFVWSKLFCAVKYKSLLRDYLRRNKEKYLNNIYYKVSISIDYQEVT